MTIHTGDCIEVMAAMDADSVDAIVTDPPYGIGFMGKAWDSMDKDAVEASWSGKGRNQEAKRDPSAATPGGRMTTGTGFRDTNPRCGNCGRVTRGRDTAKGFKVCHCETPVLVGTPNRDARRFQEWCRLWGEQAFRVTKPGGYLLAFGGTRTHHRLVCGLEDAGWIIRDELEWIYASGFPKGKANLKPAHEPIVLARKPGPLRPLAIDECRIGTGGDKGEWPVTDRVTNSTFDQVRHAGTTRQEVGRWPSNVLLSDPALFDEPNPEVVGSGATAETPYVVRATAENRGMYSPGTRPVGEIAGYGDSGGYSRFFIVPKSSRSDREPVIVPDGHDRTKRFSTHPTQKPTDLMAHLIKLVTPTDGVVLDPFLGSGSTAVAAERLGVKWLGIEKEPEYVAIAEARLNGTQRGLGLGA